MTKHPWFKFYVDDWIGVSGMPPETQALYLQIIVRIYATGEGVEADEVGAVFAAAGLSPKRGQTALDRLVRKGKIRVEGGRFVNDRPLREAAERKSGARR